MADLCKPGDSANPKKDSATDTDDLITTLLESVFTNYDHEGRGSISQEDFEKIAASFPFSFCVVDKDKDGLISREGIMAYFMWASVLCSKLGLGFSHNFQETTYMRPTFCDNCSGLLWGMIKQGYRCRDCGMNCHKSCKDQAAFECKKTIKSCSNADWSLPSNTLDTTAAGGHDDESSTSHTTITLVHRSTQTEAVSASQLLPSLLSPSLTAHAPCPSPVSQRKRACANKTSTTLTPGEENKLTNEALEKENHSLMKSNESLRQKLKEAECEVEILKTLLKQHTLCPVEEDSSPSP